MKASVTKFETLVCTALALSVVTTFAALLNALADPDGEVRHHAGEALRLAGPAAQPVLPM